MNYIFVHMKYVYNALSMIHGNTEILFIILILTTY